MPPQCGRRDTRKVLIPEIKAVVHRLYLANPHLPRYAHAEIAVAEVPSMKIPDQISLPPIIGH